MSPVLLLVLVGLSACTSSVSPPSVAAPSRGPAAELRRLVVVPSGESTLTIPPTAGGGSAGGDSSAWRVVGEIAKWYPKAALWASLAAVVQRGIDWIFEDGRSPATDRHVRGILPAAVVAEAFTRALATSGRFDEVRMVAREPIGDDRRESEALVRVIVPAWGVVRVREGTPELMAAYADTRAQVVVRPTGTVVWEHDEDVTHGERLPLQAFSTDSDLARQALLDVLERAGQRLANELLYARSAAR
jgi:hypothetical protein